MLCSCDYPNYIEEIGYWDGCPLEGGHTAFAVNKCKNCGGVSGFPQYNFELALKEGTRETKEKLRQIIYGR